jgi:UDP-3-O-[3-hydroxymyristoyl] N-acetylglucosamine deacetylase
MLLETNEAQRTLGGDFALEGVGLHKGKPARLRCRPAPPNHGVVFRRVDLGASSLIPARLSMVNGSALKRQTSLGGEQLGRVETCEHLLSAFFGLGIDNAVVEIDADEVPLFDGSSILFCERIAEAGVLPQDAARRVVGLDEQVVFDEGGVEIVYTPAEGFAATVFVDYGVADVAGPQAFQYVHGETDYAAEVAPARTFVFTREIEGLRAAGLIKGGSLDNAIVIDAEEGRIVNGETRFPDELARHKTLDLLGDLMLLGCRPRGHVTANRAGHASHLAFARLLNS